MEIDPTEQRPFDTLQGIMPWFAGKIEEKYQEVQAFTRCERCSNTETDCENCEWKRSNLKDEQSGWITSLCAVIVWFYMSKDLGIPSFRQSDPGLEARLEENRHFAAKRRDEEMASCWEPPNEVNATSYLVDAKFALEIKSKWDEDCKDQRRMYDIDKAKGFATEIDEWRQWAGRTIFDSSVKIKEWETEGWYDKWMARPEQDYQSEWLKFLNSK